MPAELVLAVFAILGGFVVVMKSADWFVRGAAAIAYNLGISPLIIGLTIVAIGTSAPEILISIMASLDGKPGLAVGNALGSNIANIALVLGITALIVPLVVRSETLRREYPVMFLIMLVALLLLMDGELDRLDGAILVGGMLLVIWWMVQLGRQRDHDPLESEYDQEIPHLKLGRALLWLGLGLALLLLSSRLLVWGAVTVAQALGVSELVIGLTVVAVGTSMPELAASVMGALRQEPDIAVGNIIGSNIFNLLVVLGLPGLLAPLSLEPGVLSRDFPIMIGLSIALFAMAYGIRGDGRITRVEGALLLLAYIAYITLLYFNAT